MPNVSIKLLREGAKLPVRGSASAAGYDLYACLDGDQELTIPPHSTAMLPTGLSFALLPHLAVALLTLIVEMALLPSEAWGGVLPSLGIWLVVQSATFLFFFSFAVFCAMFTGHILALPAFYAILNALVMVVWSLFNELMSLFFYGYVYRSMPGLVLLCTPVAKLMEACGWSIGQVTVGDAAMTTGDWYLNPRHCGRLCRRGAGICPAGPDGLPLPPCGVGRGCGGHRPGAAGVQIRGGAVLRAVHRHLDRRLFRLV